MLYCIIEIYPWISIRLSFVKVESQQKKDKCG